MKVKRVFRRRRQVSLLPNYIVMALLGVFALAPLTTLAFNSFKSNLEIGENFLLPPREPHPENYPEAWVVGNFKVTVRNSLFLVITVVALVLLLGGMAAYSLARLRPPGSDAYMLYMVTLSTVPVWLYLVPLFIILKRVGLIDTLFGVVLLYVALNSPFSIFLLRSYMVHVPQDFEDAARVDGANEWDVLTTVVLPMVYPAFLTVGLTVALAVWNEFNIAYVFIHDPNLQPVATSYHAFRRRFGTDWALSSAAAMMMITPVIAFFLAMQRRFVEGLTRGGLAGT